MKEEVENSRQEDAGAKEKKKLKDEISEFIKFKPKIE